MTQPVHTETDLYLLGIQALQAGNAESAKRYFLQKIASQSVTVADFLGLALAWRSLQNIAAAMDALDQALQLEPSNLNALVLKGDWLLAQQDKRGATHCYGLAINIAKNQTELPADLQQTISRVSRLADEINGQIQQHIIDKLHQKQVDLSASNPRFNQALDLLSGKKERYEQQPRAFFYPELPTIQFYDPTSFSWAEKLAAATGEIVQELQAVLETGQGLQPYVAKEEQGPSGHVNALLDDNKWQAFFLYKDGEPIEENIARCPNTMKALQEIPFPKIKGRGPMVLFSILQPGAKIAPHTGFLNTRLICHLPLIAPANCYLRVGNEVREWQQGKLMIFNDAIEHEAWNDSNETRVVMIFDIWRPELTQAEQGDIANLLSAVDSFNG